MNNSGNKEKKGVCKLVALTAEKVAVNSGNSACAWWMYQPQEPVELQNHTKVKR